MRVRLWVCLFVLAYSLPAQARNLGEGKVGFGGAVIEVPCNIDTPSLDQAIDYGEVAINKANGLRKQFDIKLLDCVLASASKPGYHYRKANITFYGQPDDRDKTLLGVSGSAQGVAIYLEDQNQKAIVLGATHHDYDLVSGDNHIRFMTELRVDNDRRGVGHFSGLLQFLVSYF